LRTKRPWGSKLSPLIYRIRSKGGPFLWFLSIPGPTTPLLLRFGCSRSCFHPSGSRLRSKHFCLIPLNNSNFSRSIINFNTVSPACFTIRPATCTSFQRNVPIVCFAQDSGHESRLNPINRLYAMTPIPKKRPHWHSSGRKASAPYPSQS
jgi:hypothetical protein